MSREYYSRNRPYRISHNLFGLPLIFVFFRRLSSWLRSSISLLMQLNAIVFNWNLFSHMLDYFVYFLFWFNFAWLDKLISTHTFFLLTLPKACFDHLQGIFLHKSHPKKSVNTVIITTYYHPWSSSFAEELKLWTNTPTQSSLFLSQHWHVWYSPKHTLSVFRSTLSLSLCLAFTASQYWTCLSWLTIQKCATDL